MMVKRRRQRGHAANSRHLFNLVIVRLVKKLGILGEYTRYYEIHLTAQRLIILECIAVISTSDLPLLRLGPLLLTSVTNGFYTCCVCLHFDIT